MKWIRNILNFIKEAIIPPPSYYEEEVDRLISEIVATHMAELRVMEINHRKIAAASVLEKIVGKDRYAFYYSTQDVIGLIREAEFKTHPDKGGSPEDFKKVQLAREVLLP